MRLLALAVLALLLPAADTSDAGNTFALFKCTVTLPVVHQTTNTQGEQVLATVKLDSADLVNLALGRPLDTKLDKDTEVLAFASNQTTPGAGSRLVVLNPGNDTVTATVFLTSDFVLLHNEDFSKNSAFAHGDIQATVLGTPAENGFGASSLALSGNGKSAGSFSSTAVTGPVSFVFTDDDGLHEIEGVVLKGKLKAGGPQLASLRL